MQAYQKLTAEILAALRVIVGAENLLADAEIPVKYAQDASTKNGPLQYPEAVVLVDNALQVAAIMKLANKELIPVTPRGGGSGLAGGAVAVNGGIVLDLSHMNKILHVDAAAKYMVVEPGVRTIDIQETARQYGLLYAGDPCSSDDCVIAGNVATNAGGNRAVKYGVTGDQVYELEVVTPQGEIVTLGRRLKKNSSGYGLVKLIAGSEGTLGIITRVTVKLQKLAPILCNFLAVFSSLSSAITLVGTLLDDNFIDLISLEIIDRKTLLLLERYQQENIFPQHQGDSLIIQIEAQNQHDLVQKRERLQQICRNSDCLCIDEVEGDKIWQARRVWGKAIEADYPIGASEDVVVPVNEIAQFITVLEKLSAEFNFTFHIAGHAGDGNTHIRLLPGTVPPAKWEEQLKEFRRKLYATVYALGGQLSGEHGIGIKRKHFLQAIINPVELELMRAVKKAFDPNYILNPGKIFDFDVN